MLTINIKLEKDNYNSYPKSDIINIEFYEDTVKFIIGDSQGNRELTISKENAQKLANLIKFSFD